MIEDVAHDGGRGDAGQDADTPAAGLAAQDVDAENPAQQLGPRQSVSAGAGQGGALGGGGSEAGGSGAAEGTTWARCFACEENNP
ncbi:MAG: hypothetical protein AABZ70_06460 [candidate division NC10 bacterium]